MSALPGPDGITVTVGDGPPPAAGKSIPGSTGELSLDPVKLVRLTTMVTAICQRHGPVDYGRAWRAVTAGAIPHAMVRNKIMVDPADAERLAAALGLAARQPTAA